MKKGKNKAPKLSKRHSKVQKGQVGASGVATAPRKRPFLELAPATIENHGHGHGFKEDVQAGSPDTLTLIANSSVCRVTADDGTIHFVWKLLDKVALISALALVHSFTKLSEALIPLGILLISPAQRAAARQKLEEAPVSHDIVVSTRAGYEAGAQPRFYVFGDGTVVGDGQELRVLHEGSNPRFKAIGSWRRYEKVLSPVLRDQPIPILVFFFALTPILQPFAKDAGFLVMNTILELSGRSSRYKSSLTNFVAGSVWGGSSEPLGFADPWNLTPAKAEQIFRDQNNALVVLDEATAAGGSSKERGHLIANVAHRLASGRVRGRMDTSSEAFSAMVLSNSNESLMSILDYAPDVKAALEVRLVTIEVPSRDTGVFETVPEGYSTVGEAMENVFKLTAEHRGKLAKRFVRRVLRWNRRDPEGFLRTLRGAVDQFMARVGLDSPKADLVEVRRAKPFALAYAAAVLSFKMGVLKSKRWGSVRRSLRQAWLRYGRLTVKGGAHSAVDGFLADRSNQLVQVPSGPRSEVPKADFEKIAGLIYRDKRRQLCLAMTAKMVKRHLGYDAAKLKQLRREGGIICGEHLQMRLRLRRENGKEVRESFYVFPIDAVPEHASPLG